MGLWEAESLVIASQRARPEVAGPMTGSAKQSRKRTPQLRLLDCFVALRAPRNDEGVAQRVGWVEARSADTHRQVLMGFAPLNPSYAYANRSGENRVTHHFVGRERPRRLSAGRDKAQILEMTFSNV